MARRSYLQRVAEPLRPGDPVLFAVPHPLPGEQRAAAELPTSRPAAAPPNAPALRRRVAGDAGVVPGAAAAPAVDRAAPFQDAIVSAHPIAALNDTSAPGTPAAQPPGPAAKSVTLRAPARVARPEALSPEAPALAPAAARTTARGERVPEARIAPSAPSPASAAASTQPAATIPISAVTTAPRAAPVAREAENFFGARPSAPPATLDTSPPPTPRIHIGTVEVRSAAPTPAHAPQPAAAPRADAAPIARGYAWRFGLVQG